jgi:hypothetical protein
MLHPGLHCGAQAHIVASASTHHGKHLHASWHICRHKDTSKPVQAQRGMNTVVGCSKLLATKHYPKHILWGNPEQVSQVN